MIARFGFVLVLALFGALMFAAGLLAPEPWRQAASTWSERIGRDVEDAGADTSSAEHAEKGEPTAPGGQAEGKAEPGQEPPPLAAESLLIPTPMPEQGRYALQAGQFADPAQAQTLGTRIQALKLPFDKVLDVIDRDGQRWSVVAIGPYPDVNAARAARPQAARALGIDSALPLILLPEPKPAAGPAPG